MPTFVDGEAALSVFNKLNNAILRAERTMVVDDVTQLASLVYTAGSQWTVSAGMQVLTAKEGFLYDVLAAAATPFDIQPGAVKLDHVPGANGAYNFRAMLPAADGTTDDYPLLAKLLAKPGGGFMSIYFPIGNYRMNSTIELKRVVTLWGDAGYANEAAARLTFASNTMGIVVNRGNTLNGDTEAIPTGGADGSEISGLYLTGSGTNRARHGIWLRARGTIINTYIRGFPGNGVNIVASAGFGGAVEGNANSFLVANVACVQNGNHGFYADGADANAGTIINLDCSANGRCGIYDSSFLGNTYIGCHTGENGLASIGGNPVGSSSMVSFGGNVYVAHWTATETQLVNTTPGTNSNVWLFDRVGGPFGSTVPLWQAGQSVGTYFVAFSYFTDSTSASNVFLGCYSESGPSGNVFLGPTITLGGSMSIYYSGNRLGSAANGVLASTSMLFGGTNITAQIADGSNFLTLSGVNPLGEIWRFKRMSNTNLRFDNGDLGSRVVYEITGPDATNPYKFSVGDFLHNGVRSAILSAAPTTEFWPTGSYVRNTSVASGVPRGWRCTVGGTPGTWVADSNWP